MNLESLRSVLKYQTKDSMRIDGDLMRIRGVIVSPVFFRLLVGCGKEGLSLWMHIQRNTALAGNPTDLRIDSNFDSNTWRISDGKTSESIKAEFNRFLVKPISDTRWQLRAKAFFIYFNYLTEVHEEKLNDENSFEISFLIKKSASFNSTPDTYVNWQVSLSGDGVLEVELRLLADSPLLPDVSQKMLNMLSAVVKTSDVADLRRQEILNQLQREQEFRLSQDLCLECGEPCVQRRRKSDGHVFFGCSQFVNKKCKGTRNINCPICSHEMVEKVSRKGKAFLGCPTWPRCNGSRSIDEKLKVRRSPTQASGGEYEESLDELARDWGWSDWQAFDESHE